MEDAEYEGHSLSMLRRIAHALHSRVRIQFVGETGIVPSPTKPGVQKVASPSVQKVEGIRGAKIERIKVAKRLTGKATKAAKKSASSTAGYKAGKKRQPL
jgi:hypothetical protein